MVAKRSTLRKGKWTAEEEEYTQQIIDYFNEGLVPLPEGVTLRAFLAEKLNCDPMRITKKFTGTHCLGKRLYHAAASAAGAAAPDAVARADVHLRQLEARFLNRVERSKDADFCGIVELDPAWYNHPNIISTPAIDALIQQSLHDPNFWLDHSDGEEDGYDEDSEAGSEAAAAAAAGGTDDCLLFPQPLPLCLSSGSLVGFAHHHQQHQEVKEDPHGEGIMAAHAHPPTMAMAMAPGLLFGARAPAAKFRRLEEGHTDGSDCGSGSDSEEGGAVAVAVGQKRPRGRQQAFVLAAEDEEGGFAQYHDVEGEEEEEEEDNGPVGLPVVRHFSSSSSTTSACSARTLSGLSAVGSGGEEEDEAAAAADGAARRMMDVVGRLRKRGSHEDLVTFVCEVSQKQPQQQQPQLPQMVVHCI